MRRRWILRVGVIALACLCVAVWGRGYSYAEAIGFGDRGEFFAVFGGGRMGLVAGSMNVNDRHGWYYECYPYLGGEVGGAARDWRFAGFRLSYQWTGWNTLIVEVPFWFLTLLSGAGVWVVWRRTGAQREGR